MVENCTAVCIAAYGNTALSRHFIRKHRNEPRINKVLSLGKKRRDAEFANLRREGDYSSNIMKLKENNYDLTVVRNGKVSADQYTVCTNCYGFF